MDYIELKAQERRPYALPENFNINKVDGEDTQINKSEAISQRVSEIFSENKGTIATIFLLTLPLFPITWPAAYAIIRQCYAKQDVNEALKNTRLNLLSKEGEIGKLITDLKNDNTSKTKNFSDATNIIKLKLTTTDVFDKYFKKSHAEMVTKSPTPAAKKGESANETWNSYKAKAKQDLAEISEMKSSLQSNLKINSTELDNRLLKVIDATSEKSVKQKTRMQQTSTTESIKKLLEDYTYNHANFISVIEGIKNKTDIKETLKTNIETVVDKDINQLKLSTAPEQSKNRLRELAGEFTSKFNKDVKAYLSHLDVEIPNLINHIENPETHTLFIDAINKAREKINDMNAYQILERNPLIDSEALIIPAYIEVTDKNLPISHLLLRDANAKLPACRVGKKIYQETPNYGHILENHTQVKGDDENRTAYKQIITEKVLTPIINIYDQINEKNQLTEERKEKLWTILQLSRTQDFQLAINNSIAGEFIPKGFTIIDDQSKQSTFTGYDYDSKKNTLDITLSRRYEFQSREVFVGKNQMGSMAPVGLYLFANFKMTLDLNADDFNRTYSVSNMQLLPVSQSTYFDSLPSGGKLPALNPDIDRNEKSVKYANKLEDYSNSNEEIDLDFEKNRSDTFFNTIYNSTNDIQDI